MTLRIDTNISLDERTIVGEVLPTVYFDKVVVEEMKNDSSNLLNSKYVTNPSPSGKYLKVDLNVVLKDVYNGKYSRWFDNPFSQDIKNNIKVAIVQTTNQNATMLWSKVKSQQTIIDIQNSTNDSSYRELLNGTNIYFFTLKEFIGSQDKNSIGEKFLEAGSTPTGPIYNFNKLISFPISQNTPGNDSLVLIPEEQEHLCYSAFTFIDNVPNQSTFGMSKINQEMVIRNKKIVRESSIFTTQGDNGGKVWTGPVHYHDGDIQVNGQPYTGYMGGSTHGTTQNQPLLTRQVVKNSTIHDLRSLSIVENNILFKRPVEENKNSNQAVQKNSVFSNIYFSREADGKIDFTFAVDLNSLIKSKSLDSYNLKDSAINNLINYFSISSLKVYRVKMNDEPILDKTLDAPTDSPSLTKIFKPVMSLSKVNANKMNKKPEKGLKYIKTGKGYTKEFKKPYLDDMNRELIIDAKSQNNEIILNDSSGDGQSQVAARTNIFLKQDTKENIIYITGTDKTIQRVDNGIYQYEIEISIEDNRTEYFTKLKAKIDKQIENLNLISGIVGATKKKPHAKSSYVPNDLVADSYYNDNLNKFTNSFINKISYNSSLINISGDYWDEIPSLYMEAFDLLSYNSFPDEIKQNAQMTIRNILNPFSGTASGYLRVVKMLENISDLLSRNIFVSRKNYGSKNQQNETSKSKASKNNNNPIVNEITLNHLFKNNFVDASKLKNFGNIFFKMSNDDLPNETAGIRTITYEKFVEYKNAEIEKIYSSPNADISIASLPDAQMNLDITSYTYFTPSIVYNNKKEPDCIESVLSFDEQYVDMVVTGLSSNDNLNLSGDLNNIGKNSLEREINSSNQRLDNFLSIKHGVSVVTEEVGSNVFTAKKNGKTAPSSINDVGGNLKKDKSNKKLSASDISKSRNALKTILVSKAVLKTEKPTVTQFNPEVLSTDCDETEQVISALPNQLKALVTAQDFRKDRTFSPTPGIKPEVTNLINQDPFNNPKTENIAKNLFENIAVVQYLSGYEINENNNISIKDDSWKPLTKNIFDNARVSNKKLLCRLLSYSNPRFNIKYDENIPIIDSYFFISAQEDNVVFESLIQPQIQSSPLSNTFDNPQYQMTYYRENENIQTEGTRRSLTSRPRQQALPSINNAVSSGGVSSGGVSSGGVTTGGSY